MTYCCITITAFMFKLQTMLENEKNGLNISFYFQGHWPFPRDKLMQGYAYILTHPGTVSP